MSASLSTHVLDTQGGRPAEGVPVRLYRGEDLVSERVTDGEGRIADLATGLEPGEYRLVFRPASPFFRRLEVELELGEGDFHVPLLLSPFSCTIYRGS
jgi:5-hydroxyisourate hydrolase